jgi:hypothetical protein
VELALHTTLRPPPLFLLPSSNCCDPHLKIDQADDAGSCEERSRDVQYFEETAELLNVVPSR